MPKSHTYVLGLNTYDHDVSACLLRDGAIAVAIAKERITREKHASGFYQEVIDYCLKAEGITLDDVDLVVRNCYILPVPEMEERLVYQDMPGFLPEPERATATAHPLFQSTSAKVVSISHHLAHAFSAFAASPFDEGAVMIVDGVGSYKSDVSEPYPADAAGPLARESESYYTFKGRELTCLKKVWMEPERGFLSDEFYNMRGLGALYSRASTYVFGDWNKCGELMGLAPYGRPGHARSLMQLRDGELDVPPWTRDLDHPFILDTDQSWENSPNVTHWQDLAWRVQDDTENVLLARAKWLRETTGAKNLCIAGGVALNCVANGRIAREAGFDNVWIQPAAGDDGIAIGCALYGHLVLLQQPRGYVMEHAYTGRRYGDDEIDAAIKRSLISVQTTVTRSADIAADTAKLLADQKVIGWFQGRSEFGPRALGNRSLIADPRRAEMKDILNKRVKHRQAFRPFAPIVLHERAREVFEGEEDSPFMLIAKRVRDEWRDRIPAIVHVDGTARVQTVREQTNPELYRLLKAFEALTGVPVLLNTSFNVKGEPIVETPRDAVACFLTTGIDHLVLHDRLVSKNALHPVVNPLVEIYSDVASIVVSSMRS
ncbi:carbamoyltransferase [Bradyrhizobium sp. U87765 SZCCT0131]|uniref:carbamoyltransferase family protein n=1 Tax=unclassified Bradyrhizobium TaxID=2631580 RepID=UPI001BA549E5|nr:MULTISPECIES: carbamoyltransferase C-terminal domain-containing protein [unclassified Bradyrhizobium]MBR1217654.1 carbamoyltransferase [Bradyrhizobium sp. U87765 SZCCT0131]MBR1261400.1 carbamoyltransferase [Bradyrhizobium sp. U87765 SZCCT0134]MBR1303152.1 carbamoyltransferase [Bradyrhizobium sp. U87765 SZCCT0110]MBR1318758.1 carbamoyltransferase [Bradyrhizobium sp. U87765 SZCCT0109]MBR1347083.1 carbamoyltransferase [Bradyrhizobium sp. U87765 SZCCT0048]